MSCISLLDTSVISSKKFDLSKEVICSMEKVVLNYRSGLAIPYPLNISLNRGLSSVCFKEQALLDFVFPVVPHFITFLHISSYGISQTSLQKPMYHGVNDSTLRRKVVLNKMCCSCEYGFIFLVYVQNSHSDNNHWLCYTSISDYPSYWQLTHYTENYLWHIFSATPEHQGSTNTRQVYHFWHQMSFISRSWWSSLYRPVLWEGKDIRAPVSFKQLILLHFVFHY